MNNTLTDLLNSNEKDLALIFEYLKGYNLLVPLKEDKIVIKNNYILLYTQRNQIKNIIYDKLNRTKLDKVIKELYNENYKGIIINPDTEDFILEESLINIYLKYIEMTK